MADECAPVCARAFCRRQRHASTRASARALACALMTLSAVDCGPALFGMMYNEHVGGGGGGGGERLLHDFATMRTYVRLGLVEEEEGRHCCA